jgi:hypothetical protein
VPTPTEHIDKALSNYDLLSHLSTNRPHQQDWMITIQFYCILHLTKAYLRHNQVPESGITTHKDIGKVIKDRIKANDLFLNARVAPNRNFRTVYEELQELSNRARYLEGKGKQKGFHPIDDKAWEEAIRATDTLLAHFLTNHPKTAQHPLNRLNGLWPITFTNIPQATPWTSQSGLFVIQ